MQRREADSLWLRRHILQTLGAGGALLGSTPHLLLGDTTPPPLPHAGGIAHVRGYDPLGWDPMLTTSYRTHIAASLTHNRLFRYQPGPDIPIGTMRLEPDLVQRWEALSATRYVLHLRRGVYWHDKPPVRGRELVAEDVRYSIERFLTVPGNANRPLLADIAEVKTLEPYTVQIDLHHPNVWLLDYLADASTLPILAREAVEQFGDVKQLEAVIGTGPWMLSTYEPKVKAIFTRHPRYFRPGLPHLDAIHFLVLDDDSTASAAYMAGQLDFGWSLNMSIRREELETFRAKHPAWHYQPFLWNLYSCLGLRTDRAPFHDQRVRQAVSMALNRQEMLDTLYAGQGQIDTAIPAALQEWHLPVDQLGEGARYYQYNPEAARRLLHEAGYPQGFHTSMTVYTGYGTLWNDLITLVTTALRGVGITVQLVPKEYGAWVQALSTRSYEQMILFQDRPYVMPDGFVYERYQPDTPRNLSFVNDPELRELTQAQRREPDPAKRKAIFDAFSRLAAVKQYYVSLVAGVAVASWPPHVQHFQTNLGYDYGARLEGAWLRRG